MATNAAVLREDSLGQTQRRDAWWIQPLAMALAFGAFIIFATIRGLMNRHYEFGHGVMRPEGGPLMPESAYFLSPFYSPLLAMPSWMPTSAC